MVLDLSAGAQSYVEDCEICCRPVQVSFDPANEELASFDAASIEQ